MEVAEVVGRLAAANPDLGLVEELGEGPREAGPPAAELTDPDLVNQLEQPGPHILEREDYAMKMVPKAQSQQPSARAQQVQLERVTSRQVASKQKILDFSEVRKSRKGKKSLAIYGFKPGHSELGQKKKQGSQLPLLQNAVLKKKPAHRLVDRREAAAQQSPEVLERLGMAQVRT